jgi:hypothetical protein
VTPRRQRGANPAAASAFATASPPSRMSQACASPSAPGWDTYALEARYKDWVATRDKPPRDPGRAFLGWVRKFTKGRPP